MRQNTITADEMKAVDRNAVALGMHPLQLMENAGAAVADTVLKYCNSSSCVWFFAGLGNNGGDALTAARHLANHNIFSVVFLLGKADRIQTPEARANFVLLKQTPQVTVFEVPCASDLPVALSRCPASPDVIVDGLLGTGFGGEIREPIRTAAERINACRKNSSALTVVSIDLPSGLPTGSVSEGASVCIRADVTVTFHKMKTYLQGAAAQKNAGNVIVRPIGIPENAEKYIGPGDLSRLYRRRADSKKGDSGKVLVIASGAYAGAPALAALGALRAGCDLAAVAAPTAVQTPIASFAPELILKKLPGEALSESDVSQLAEWIPSYDAVVLGPGFGKSPKALCAAAQCIPFFKKAVIDADALHPAVFEALADRKKDTEVILTPHYHEFLTTAAFFGISLPARRDPSASEELEAALAEVSQKLNATVLLKGKEDLIAAGGSGEIRRNATGNAGMSVGGTGDVLAGVAAGLLAKNNSVTAACGAAYACGKAGDLAFADNGFSLIPTDLLEKLPKTFL